MRRQRSLAAFRLAVFEKYREYARQPGTRLFMTIRLQALYRARKARRLANKLRRKRAERALRRLEFRQLPLHVREALGASLDHIAEYIGLKARSSGIVVD